MYLFYVQEANYQDIQSRLENMVFDWSQEKEKLN